MEQIKNEYPNADKIHVFPAMPNSSCDTSRDGYYAKGGFANSYI